MSEKRPQSRFKIDRRIGANLWGSVKSPLARGRNTGPGQHGSNRKKKSDYGNQLTAKQTLKGYYGNIGEKQFRRYYDEANRRRGDTGEILVGLLESRLDAIIYRMKFAPTVFSARQLVNHCHVLVNGQRVNIPSYLVQPGDKVELKKKAQTIPAVLQAIQSSERDVPDYCDVDHKTFSGTFLRIPSLADIPYPVQMEPNLVIEFYSR